MRRIQQHLPTEQKIPQLNSSSKLRFVHQRAAADMHLIQSFNQSTRLPGPSAKKQQVHPTAVINSTLAVARACKLHDATRQR
jgi:hypothetical protein